MLLDRMKVTYKGKFNMLWLGKWMMFFGFDKLVFEGLKRLSKEVDMILGELLSKFGSKKMLRLRKDT